MTRLLTFILMFVLVQGTCQIGASFPYFLSSPNDRFYLKSIPFASQLWEDQGRTDIFNSSDSLLLYSIPKYFPPQGIVLGNDGAAILIVKYSIYNDDEFDERAVLYYDEGKIAKTYLVNQLVQKNLDDYYYTLFYDSWEGWEWDNGRYIFPDSITAYKAKLLEWPFYTDGETTFLATKDFELLQFDLRTGNMINRQRIDNSEEIVDRHFHEPKIIKPEFNWPGSKLPLLSNGDEYYKSFENEFDYKYDGVMKKDKYKYYLLELNCLIDLTGVCLQVEADFEDSTLNKQIEDFFLGQTFDENSIPDITEQWYFYQKDYFRKSDTLVAINERIEEKKQERKHELWRIKQDTLDGVYIPKDLKDCLSELDKLLTENNREKFGETMPADYHMGLGTNLRNRWGLWSSSRLREYFLDLGVTHPDDMSSIILDGYHLYLNENEIALDRLLSRYFLKPRPKLKLPKDYEEQEK
ncbi:hypothetical protein O3Q51_05055 [Cryomorphaceae bacterium 1068]|nr:hypothetical protein [Cryomorphaceae bacterium 1068]